MNELTSRLSNYDVIGYFFTGSFFYALILVILKLSGNIAWVADYQSLELLPVLYFFGHLLASISTKLLPGDGNSFSESEKVLLAKYKEKVGVYETEDQRTFQSLQIYMLPYDKTGHINIMNINFGINRNYFSAIIISIIISLIFFIIELIRGNCLYHLLIFGLVASAASWLIDSRAKKFHSAFKHKVFRLYQIHLAETSNGSTP